ncbi:MAG: GAF domain-containing SpoIIE family protein phosphatase, partial [Chloroflexota bacterium]
MTEISQYEQQIAKLERELDDMTAALSQAWDQLVPFLQEVPDEAEAANDFEPILQAVCAAADTDYGGIYLFQAGEWVSVPENLTVADDFIGRLAVVTVPQVLVQVNPEARITWVFAPVISEHKPVGALGVGTADLDRDFTAVDIRILTRMADRIGSQVAAAQLARFREREAVRNREMQIANDIQQSVQPAMPPQNERIQIGSYWKPAKEVGGDAWGWVQADDEHLTWFILDVAGKGLPAALAAVALHTAISMALRTQLAPADVLADVNEQMYDAYTRTDLMATAAVISLNPVRGVLEVANAGHPPVLVRQGGYWQQLEATAPPIGVLPDLMAETQRLELNANDLILCYSDGFSEIQTGGSLLGHDGLLRMIPAGAKNVQALTQHIVTASKSIGVATDDQTLVTALYTREVTEDNFMEEHTTFPAT